MNQYQDLYEEDKKCIPVAEAIYIPRIDTDNPYVTALPTKRTKEELAEECTVFPGMPTITALRAYTIEEQLDIMRKFSKIRMCLPYYAAIEENIDRALTESYERRITIKNANDQHEQYIFNNKKITNNQCMRIKELSDAPTGFAILGRSGCGKSTGTNNVLRKYPRVIIHNPGTMKQHIQIPILAVQMTENSNFHGLYQSIGRQIDKILGFTVKVYENELGQKGDKLPQKFQKLCDLIEKFSIGLLIIDEIELISKYRVSEGTLETFMSLANQTGISIGVIGTEEAFSKLFYKDRIARRMGELINADAYCASKNVITIILHTLYTYLPAKIELTQECIDAYYKVSNGIIAYLIKIIEHVAKNLIMQTAQNKTPSITPEIIKKIAKKHLAGKLTLERFIQKDLILEDEDYKELTARMLLGSKNDGIPNELPETMKSNRQPNLSNIVKSAIHAFENNNFRDEEIESALYKACKKIQDNDLQKIISATIIELKSKQKQKLEKKKKIEKEKQSLIDLENLKNTLPIAAIPSQKTQKGDVMQ